MTSLSVLGAALCAVALATAPACARAQTPSQTQAQAPTDDRAVASAAVQRYLASHGDFCLGKFDWPVDLSALDERAHGRDAIQMPVLESLGLASSNMATAMRVEGHDVEEGAAPAPVAVRRYVLTPAAQAWVKSRETVVDSPQGERVVYRDDLCVATLGLDAVVDWKPAPAPSSSPGATPDFVATYTYVATAAPWAASAEFRQAFPMAARVVDGARAMLLKQRFKLVDGTWLPAGLAD